MPFYFPNPMGTIAWGETEAEFKRNLDEVLGRFRKHGITVNPDKCKFGVEAIEYVGHVISQNGIHFTRDKLDSVTNFPHQKQRVN